MMDRRKHFVAAAVIAALIVSGLSGCESKPKPKHYTLRGEVISVTPGGSSLTVKHGDIPGFMSAMTMSYAVADPKEAEGLHPGDQISADLVVNDGRTELEKIVVTEKGMPANTAPGEPKR